MVLPVGWFRQCGSRGWGSCSRGSGSE
ncbi:hypothetical protein BKA15_005627 [Microlunatus parietis]|uniref:Uncharacterized protein n=2 Tax=Microlunatus parietis TaxID=682979 RepID=A0A7Y9ICC0_9ACTN|nr:hypothetical protein [Microlunatus parietis]NYE72964.1 hypothetical protein [Microlunatus parietis]NYE74298.1 hypothetical protein [Microlunatus parietis]